MLTFAHFSSFSRALGLRLIFILVNVLDNCPYLPQEDHMKFTPFGKSYEEENRQFERKLEKFKKKYKHMKFTVVWQCVAEKLLSQSFDFLTMERETYLAPFSRLAPRWSCFGGRTELIKTRWIKSENPKKSCFYLDCNSLHLWVAGNYDYPYGKRSVYLDSEILDNFDCDQYHGLVWKGTTSQVFGFIKVAVTVHDAHLPFLPNRIGRYGEEEVLHVLCQLCGSKKQSSVCEHSSSQSMQVLTMTLSTFNYSMRNQYIAPLRLLEVWSFDKHGKIFAKFYETISSIKNEYEETNELEKLKMLKNSINMALGHFIVREKDKETKTCKNFYELNEIFKKKKVIGINPLGDSLLDVTYELDLSNSQHNLYKSIPIGSHILGYARQYINEIMAEIKTLFPSMEVLLINSDALLICLDDTEDLSKLRISKQPGDLKHVLNCDSIESFIGFSAYGYQLCYKAKNGELVQKSRFSGFALQNILTQPIMEELDMNDFFMAAANYNEQRHVLIPQIRRKVDKCTPGITNERILLKLSNTIAQRRIMLENYDSLPFGSNRLLFTIHAPQMIDPHVFEFVDEMIVDNVMLPSLDDICILHQEDENLTFDTKS